MSTNHPGQQSVIYQADPSIIPHLHGIRDTLHSSCKQYLNRQVQVQTLDGQVHEGIICGLDNKHLYLKPAMDAQMTRGFYNPYTPYQPPYQPYPPYYQPYPPYPVNPISNVILPLVLYELLVISLL